MNYVSVDGNQHNLTAQKKKKKAKTQQEKKTIKHHNFTITANHHLKQNKQTNRHLY